MMGHSTEIGIIPRFCEELVDRTETCPDNIVSETFPADTE